MNLEELPTSPSAKRMLSYVSGGFYDESYVGKWIYQAIGLEVDAAESYLDELPLQAYVGTATWGLRYWEEAYGVETDESLGLEARRARLLAIEESSSGAMNPARMAAVAAGLTGRECTVEESPSTLTFTVTIGNGAPFRLDRLLNEMDRRKPAHLEARYCFGFEGGLEAWIGICTVEEKELYADEANYVCDDPLLVPA